MNNYEIIKAIEKIVYPHFEFNIEDFYGDKGSCEYPKIEDLKVLFFKLKTINNKVISKIKQQELVNEIINLNIGSVEISTIQSFGRYIVIRPL
jgi:hypothetical protein